MSNVDVVTLVQNWMEFKAVKILNVSERNFKKWFQDMGECLVDWSEGLLAKFENSKFCKDLI